MGGRRWLASPRLVAAALGALALPGAPTARLPAQGVSTAAIRVVVHASAGDEGRPARVRVVNRATGYAVEAETRHGAALVQGLAPGGPYTVTVSRIGARPQERGGIVLDLGPPLEIAFTEQPAGTVLQPMTVLVSARESALRDGGTGTIVGDSLLHRLPTLNRDFYDFARLAPQVSTRVGLAAGGLSGGGTGFRFNEFLIDGAPERALTGNSSAAFGGGKSVPIEAVKEYQVLLAPYDVRYGDFAGLLVNSVTKSGTNEFRGSAFAYTRNDRLSRQGGALNTGSYDREQVGFSIGGPLVPDRLQFFVAPEFQRLSAPAAGPWLGQSASASPPVPASAADLGRFADLLRGAGLVAGSAARVETGNPLTNVFARLDYSIPAWNSRLVVSENYARNASTAFSRAVPDTFALSSSRSTSQFTSRLSSAQLHTNLPQGGYNELVVSLQDVSTNSGADAREPVILVSVPNGGGATTILKAGSQGQVHERWWAAVLTDNLTLPAFAPHEVTVGARAEFFGLDHRGVNGGYGTWTFSSLDSLQNGLPQRFDATRDLGGSGAPLGGGQFGAWAEDRWQPGERFALTLGLRADLLAVTGHAPYTREVDSLFGRRTDLLMAPSVHLSPRVGFTWDVRGDGRDQLRGGAGIFTGRFPLYWAYSAISLYGTGTGALRCGDRSTDAGAAPRFAPDVNAVPAACANGRGSAAGDVDLVDRHLRMAQTARASLAWDRRFPGGVRATIEALVTRGLNDFAFVNLNLKGPQGQDPHGRVIYGTIDATGSAAPATKSGFSEVIDVRNTGSNRSSQLSLTLERKFGDGFGATASYTHSVVRDVELPLRAGVAGRMNWSGARVVSGPHDDLSLGVSPYDLTHRVVLALTRSARWRGSTTDLSLYYVGESGAPFTYTAFGAGRRGDLNADGATGNDPLYVPLNALDPAQIMFSGRSSASGDDNSAAAQAVRVNQQGTALEQLINGTDCLRGQRGRIMQRNSCRGPWVHTSIGSVRQSIPLAGRHDLSVQLDAFNLLNLLKGDWGLSRTANTALLEQVGETAGPVGTAQPVFRFDATRPLWVTSPTESAFQLQLSVRYGF